MKSFAGHCREETWNKALSFQQEIESWYNKKAISFNSFLNSYQQKTFLHKQFTKDELNALLSSDSSYQQRFKQQIKVSRNSISEINNETKHINDQSDLVKIAYANWASIHDHCNQSGLVINSTSSQRYMQLNQNILRDTKNLLNKYKLLISIYEKEVETLGNVHYRKIK
ncbi:hypothetical protein [Vibrio hepatarius]|uniref:hypothetical protein n=1 Tax=Vibrio hepatarius TaxID=171383 RepID=UPI001C08BE8C|nr:hypothetical protein [Vibrio hepatarius]MBU2896185.1 hypothetical protein [Vibrio hepatarius]